MIKPKRRRCILNQGERKVLLDKLKANTGDCHEPIDFIIKSIDVVSLLTSHTILSSTKTMPYLEYSMSKSYYSLASIVGGVIN